MVLHHLVEHRYGRGHRLLQDQAPLMVLKTNQNNKNEKHKNPCLRILKELCKQKK
jgi:hypothetical protein